MKYEIALVKHREDLVPWCSEDDLAASLASWLEDWGDPKGEILDSLEYVFSTDEGRGGFLVLALEGEDLAGALVMLDTGMGGYIPRHHLVYVAVSPGHRGGGLGQTLVNKGLETANTPVSLHIDQDSPARRLYERLGFAVKYLEMRTDIPLNQKEPTTRG